FTPPRIDPIAKPIIAIANLAVIFQPYQPPPDKETSKSTSCISHHRNTLSSNSSSIRHHFALGPSSRRSFPALMTVQSPH
ncbi:MAG: hypothetical protein P8M08_10135, partial [Akkermansiaceae bacterium]|nr:hypothetical protein [Akkermansiaceae bacterium]